jgi:UDP-N-acetylglucosamine diphosphorylase / glucose-1-phosphate thymidylyltransferase / UDP-N-acetylgalactosamine diphosphorylase / glucosamine-1-phosphate N-acetyltransferase / galactosamine-1-phosphate N-acetyltransferase
VTRLVLWDDPIAREFEPFALTRPVSELRAGTELVRRRWETALGARATGFVGAQHLIDFDELDAPPMATGDIGAGTIIANSRCAVALARVADGGSVWLCGGRAAAVRLDEPVAASALRDGGMSLESLAPATPDAREIEGWWLDEVWDLIRHLSEMITDDLDRRVGTLDTVNGVEVGAAIVGAHAAHVERGAIVDPYVVFDVSNGPVLVRRGAHVAPFTRLVGPCYIGENTQVGGGRIAATAIGEECRITGEVSMAVFLGHANKAHDGFVGHSYLGRWANLGASTVTSNLKNTYGTVALWTPRGMRDTGMQFLGSLIGDHAKTAIGTRLTTGSVIGAGANVFDVPMAPKVVPPFSWGAGRDAPTYAVAKFLSVAERMMHRRQVTLTERATRWLAAAHAARWTVS